MQRPDIKNRRDCQLQMNWISMASPVFKLSAHILQELVFKCISDLNSVLWMQICGMRRTQVLGDQATLVGMLVEIWHFFMDSKPLIDRYTSQKSPFCLTNIITISISCTFLKYEIQFYFKHFKCPHLKRIGIFIYYQLVLNVSLWTT